MFILSPKLAAELQQWGENWQRRARLANVTVFMGAPQVLPDEPVLEAHEIQGNILPGFTMKHQLLVGLRIRPGAVDGARSWLQSLLPTVTTMADMLGFRSFRRQARVSRDNGDRLPAVPLNLAISMSGLKLITEDANTIQDEAFKGGLHGATIRLSDPGQVGQPGNISSWKIGSSEQTVPHLLLIFASDDLNSLKAVWTQVSAPLRNAESPF